MKQTTKSIDGSLLAFLLTTVVFTSLAVNYAATMPVLVDEYAHVPAGVSYLELGRFLLYRENPPLVRCLERKTKPRFEHQIWREFWPPGEVVFYALISDSGLVSFPQDGLFLLRRG